MKKYATLMDLSKTKEDHLEFVWSHGGSNSIHVRDLRLACPCAHCVDEYTGEKILNPNSVPQTILPKRIKSIGRYAINIEWSDGHKTGIYTFESLQTFY